MHNAASALRSHFCAMIDLYERVSPIPDPQGRRERAVDTMLENLELVTTEETLTMDETFTYSALCLGAACRMAGIRPRPQEWLDAIRNVLDAGPGVRAFGSMIGAESVSQFFLDQLQLQGSNWRRSIDDLREWLPASTPAERALGVPQHLATRARPTLSDAVADCACNRDTALLLVVSACMRYLVALGLETRPEDFSEEAGQRFFRPLHDLADRLSLA